MTLIWCPVICSRDTGQLFAVERTVVILPVLGASSLTVVPLHCHSGHQGLSLGSFSYGRLPSHLAPGLGGPLCTEGVNDPGGQLAPLICTHGPSLLASIPCQAECAHLQSLALLAASDPRALNLPPACLLASCSPGPVCPSPQPNSPCAGLRRVSWGQGTAHPGPFQPQEGVVVPHVLRSDMLLRLRAVHYQCAVQETEAQREQSSTWGSTLS